MGKSIFRSKDSEGDIWCERAIVFDKSKSLNGVFTEANIRKLLGKEDKVANPLCEIKIIHRAYVHVRTTTILADGSVEANEYEFVRMNSVLII